MFVGKNGIFKYLRILMFLAVLPIVAFLILRHPQSLEMWSAWLNSNSTELAPTSGNTTEGSDPHESISVLPVLTKSNLSTLGDFETSLKTLTISPTALKISSDSHSVRENTSRPLPGVRVSSASGSSSKTQRQMSWQEAMLERFSGRVNLLKERCMSYKGNIPTSVTRTGKDVFLYSEKYNLITCITAKGGASTWKTHFLSMLGQRNIKESVHKISVSKRIVGTRRMKKSQLFRKLHRGKGEEKSVRIISVRHPFSRLVSAYRDKFTNGSRTFVSRHRVKITTTILKLMDRPVKPFQSVVVPFSLFLKGIITENNRGGVLTMNRHWRPYSSNCKPCRFPYDYIVKQETFEEDLRYIVLKLGIEEVDVTTRKNYKSLSKFPTYEAYFRDIPDDVIVRLYNIYKQDFYLFGYDVPQFVQDALANKGSR
ncbi:carbohydrate sulfotransferase 11-like isoform X1 [Palaemon carinicauda]|uniref:carbohydrate sulfotransferase 11-like isoform X1 n=1 Tax=Palaemon carinicauda TaxID=392227 RepID=UPI0035B622B8